MNKTFRRAVSFVIALAVCWLSVGSAFATSGTSGTEATEGSNVGSSLYEVTTALTAFASDVIGVNDNPHSGQDNALPAGFSHKLKEMENMNAGGGGAIVGYGDPDREFQSFLAINDTKSMTVSAYSAYMNIGDGGHAYTYVRYGRLLEDLGYDEVGNVAQVSAGRQWGGKVLAGLRVAADLMPDAFKVGLQLLNMLNPFWLLTDQTAYSTNGATAFQPGKRADPFSHQREDVPSLGPVTQTTDITEANTLMQTNLWSNEQTYSQAVNQRKTILGPVRSWFTRLYNFATSLGLVVILPLLLAILIAGILMSKNGTSHTSRIMTFVKRMVFIVIGVPLLATLYSAVLTQMTNEALGTKPSSRIIAASFVDFETWVTSSRLDLPTDVTLVSQKVSDSEEQGEASGDTWRSVRINAYKINRCSGIYNLPADHGIGFNSIGVDTNAGMFNMDGSGFTEELRNLDETENRNKEQAMRTKLNELLTDYSGGHTYTAGAWSSAIMGWLNKHVPDAELGNMQETSDSSTNMKTVFQMFTNTDEKADWLKRRNEQAATAIWTYGSDDTSAAWAPFCWNIFANGGTITNDGSHTANEDITYAGHWVQDHRNGVAVDGQTMGDNMVVPGGGSVVQMGLSTVSMYNYLASHFDTAAIRVYSGMKSVSEFTRMQHYSISMVGSGVMRVLFGINCGICLGVFVILGLVYCGGMVIHNIKNGFSMLMSIPGAMLGVMRSIAQVLVYFVAMILELFVTVFLYSVVTSFVVSFASVIESVVNPKLAELQVQACSVAGGIFGSGGFGSFANQLFSDKFMFAFGLFAVIFALCLMSYGFMRLNRVFQVSFAYASLRFWRLMTFTQMLPTFDRVVAGYSSLYVFDSFKLNFGSIFDVLVPDTIIAQEGVA